MPQFQTTLPTRKELHSETSSPQVQNTQNETTSLDSVIENEHLMKESTLNPEQTTQTK